MLSLILAFLQGRATYEQATQGISQIAQALAQASAEWVQGILPRIYADGVKTAQDALQSDEDASQGSPNTQAHSASLRLFQEDLAADLAATTTRMSDDAKASLREIGRTQISEMLSSGKSAIPQSRDMAAEMQEKGVKFTDKSGRRWDAGAYSRMVLRTKAVEVSNQANVSTAREFGSKVMRIFDGGPGDVDEPCRVANGQVWTAEYFSTHLLEHPNCRRAGSPLPSSYSGRVDRGEGATPAPEPEISQAQEAAGDYTADERELFKSVTGTDIPQDAGQAMLMMRDGDFSDISDEQNDALEALDDKFQKRAEQPSAMEQAGLSRDKAAGAFDNKYRAAEWAADFAVYSRPKDELRAFEIYKRDGYGPINNQLRRSSGNLSQVDERERDLIEKMDRSFEAAPETDRTVSLLRHGLPPEVDKVFSDRNEAALIGQVFGDEGFGSTTLDPEWKSGAVGGGNTAYLVLPKGGKALYIEGITNLKGAPEYEMLLPRGTKYRITTVDRDERDKPVIEAEIILE